MNITNSSLEFNETQYICIREEPDDFIHLSSIFQICIFLLYFIVFFLAFVGNALVCYVVKRSPRMKNVTNFFIVNLAVGDILVTSLCIPFSYISLLVLRYWPFGLAMCKIVHYSQAVSVLVSAYTLLAISVDKYMIITRPLRPRFGKTVAKIVVGIIWVGAMITAAPIFVVSELHRPSLWHEVCGLDICSEQWTYLNQSEQYTTALLTLQFALPLTVLIYTYVRIAYVVWGERPPGEAENVRDTRIHHSKRKMVKMMIIVVIVFTVCWLPLNVFIVLWTQHENDEDWNRWIGMPYVWFASHWLAMSHGCCNPIIYCYMNTTYRQGFKQALNDIFHLKLNIRSNIHPRLTVAERIPLAEMTVDVGSSSRCLHCSKCHRLRSERSDTNTGLRCICAINRRSQSFKTSKILSGSSRFFSLRS